MNSSLLNTKSAQYDLLPLAGKTIVVTRSCEQAKDLSEPLENLGANVITLPLIKILPSDHPEVIGEALHKLNSYDWVVFTSHNGVKFTMQQLFLEGLDARQFANVKIATIGPQTADALSQYGLFSDLIPKTFVSEAMLEAFIEKEKTLTGKRFLMPRGNIARDDLPSELKKHGALVDQISVYKTVNANNVSETSILVEKLKQGCIDMITFCSASAASSLRSILEDTLMDNPEILDRVVFASIGPVTSQTLKECFGRSDLEAKINNIEGLIVAIDQYYQNITQQGESTHCKESYYPSIISVINRLESTPDLLTQNWCISRETGRFLHVLALILQARNICEVGTSIGYSTLWLAWAAQQTGGKVETIEYFNERLEQAKFNLAEAGLLQHVNFNSGQALEILKQFSTSKKRFDLVFIDASKKEYIDYIRLLEPLMSQGACLVADNTRSHREEMKQFLSYMESSSIFDIADLETPNGQLIAKKR